MPFFSIIIPTYNRSEKVREAINSVLAQNFTDYELIVVDDGSTDETQEMLAAFENQIRYIRIKHSGVSAARNTGIMAGDSKYVAFLDSDDIWLAEKLSEQFAFVKNNPHIRLSQTDEVWIRNGRRVNPAVKHKKRGGHIFIDSLKLCLISPSASILERGLFDKFGMFDEKLPACEDYDLWLRILPHEQAGLLDKALTVRRAGHDGQLSQSFWGMDSFRLYSIIKLLRDNKSLKKEYAAAALESAKERCRILISGAEKRNKLEFVSKLNTVFIQLCDEDYNRIDYRILLEK